MVFKTAFLNCGGFFNFTCPTCDFQKRAKFLYRANYTPNNSCSTGIFSVSSAEAKLSTI